MAADIDRAFPVRRCCPQLLVRESGAHAEVECQCRHADSPRRWIAFPGAVTPAAGDGDAYVRVRQRPHAAVARDPGTGTVLIARAVLVAQGVKHEGRAII